MASENEWVSTSADYTKPRPPGAADAWTEEANRQSTKGSQELTRTGQAVPPPAVANAFRLAAGETAIVRGRTIYSDDAPVELADTYYPRDIAEGTALAEPRKIKGGAVTLLAELGHVAARVIEDVTARPASQAEQQQLQLADHEPVVVIERLSLNEAGKPVQADVMVAPAKLRRLRYEMKVS
ncbi:UTRA domain-containing protein [Streptomyces sp. JV180]|uniref:UTRA domain-containing protein n=1 Tax=Streptomyces sp. JV180 TaxID=858634 RepID=UPI00168B1D38|nr:UTRA domain-containing protein [Streptomyces sp. JV180]MBD3549844.1 UTRA domain-containing protein [Streptomyces sp. JV180]